MNLATCPTCRAQVSSQARQCPHCGQPFGRLTTPWYGGWVGAVVLFGVLLILGVGAGLVALHFALEDERPKPPAFAPR